METELKLIAQELDLDWTKDTLSWEELLKLSKRLQLAWTDAEEEWRNRNIPEDSWITCERY